MASCPTTTSKRSPVVRPSSARPDPRRSTCSTASARCPTRDVAHPWTRRNALMPWSQDKITQTLEAVTKRATTDEAFRKLALENPAEAVKAVARALPDALPILRFVDNAGADLTLVLPDFQAADGELSDDDLEKVAGGKTILGTTRSQKVNLFNCIC